MVGVYLQQALNCLRKVINIIELIGINKYYNRGKDIEIKALDDVNLQIDDGDMIAITGPSGSGKSTLLHIIAGIDKPTEGVYLYNGDDIWKLNDSARCNMRNKQIGVVLQDYGLLGNDTVLRNVCLPLIINGKYDKEVKIKAKKILEELNIGDFANKKANQLSGGQRQRVAIARALVMDAEIIIADEPTGALDSENTKNLMDLFADLNKKGITIIIVTHDDMVAAACKKQFKLIDGKLK